MKFSLEKQGTDKIWFRSRGANQRFTIKELKEIFGLDENVKKSNLSVGYTWNANIIVGAQKGERAYNIWLKSLYTEQT